MGAWVEQTRRMVAHAWVERTHVLLCAKQREIRDAL